MNPNRLFIRSGLGAAAGVLAWQLITSPPAFGSVNPVATVIAMLVFGTTFGVVSVVAHRQYLPRLLSCILCGLSSLVIIVGTIAALVGANLDGLISAEMVLGIVGLSSLMGIGSYCSLRVLPRLRRKCIAWWCRD